MQGGDNDQVKLKNIIEFLLHILLIKHCQMSFNKLLYLHINVHLLRKSQIKLRTTSITILFLY